MLIELRAPDRLRGPRALDMTPILGAIVEAARDSLTDLSRLRVTCDWVQYRGSFREPVVLRRIEPSVYDAAQASRSADGGARAAELAIDLRRARSGDLKQRLSELLTQTDEQRNAQHVYLERWGPGRASIIWSFNALYWRALSLWEQVTGQEYEQALPGGESDARNVEGARDLIEHLFRIWDRLADRRALHDELYVFELGVGNGNQARVFLDEFARMDREHGRDYYRRLHYLMGDYSPHVLDRARANLIDHSDRVSGLVLEAMHPTQTLGFLRYKVSLVYISNVYDNLPTDEIARLGGHLYQVQVRAYVSRADVEKIAAATGLDLDDVPEQIQRLLRLGPELLSEASPEVFPTCGTRFASTSATSRSRASIRTR
jgi:hypothetical protein